MERAGFECLAAIDFDAAAIDTFRINHPRVPHVLCEDLTRFAPEQLRELIGGKRGDVIVGGPPC